MTNIFEANLNKNPANHTPMTPLSFIERAAQVYPHQLAIIHGHLRQDWATTYSRCKKLASALQKIGIGIGDTVAVMLPNTPPMVEAHFGVPMSGAVLNCLNTRLDPEAIAFMLNHGESRVVLIDPEFSLTMKKALAIAKQQPDSRAEQIIVIDIEDDLYDGYSETLGKINYEEFLASADHPLTG